MSQTPVAQSAHSPQMRTLTHPTYQTRYPHNPGSCDTELVLVKYLNLFCRRTHIIILVQIHAIQNNCHCIYQGSTARKGQMDISFLGLFSIRCGRMQTETSTSAWYSATWESKFAFFPKRVNMRERLKNPLWNGDGQFMVLVNVCPTS